ncbi:MAG: hypothetical protein QOJ15_9882, partial [Bradyrhizobium sp.]|nr:hypothetical protein [Bradyrhizobium sp.]
IAAAVGEWSLAEVVTALRAMRGIDLISAATLLAEIGDLSRFHAHFADCERRFHSLVSTHFI